MNRGIQLQGSLGFLYLAPYWMHIVLLCVWLSGDLILVRFQAQRGVFCRTDYGVQARDLRHHNNMPVCLPEEMLGCIGLGQCTIQLRFITSN